MRAAGARKHFLANILPCETLIISAAYRVIKEMSLPRSEPRQ